LGQTDCLAKAKSNAKLNRCHFSVLLVACNEGPAGEADVDQLVEMTQGAVVDWPRLKTARDYLAMQ